MSNLQVLRLNDNDFGNDGAAGLIGSLLSLTSLFDLELGDNKFTNDVIKVLRAALKRPGLYASIC